MKQACFVAMLGTTGINLLFLASHWLNGNLLGVVYTASLALMINLTIIGLLLGSILKRLEKA